MADTSATICSSLRTPAQRVRHRLERCPRWEWNHSPPSVECAEDGSWPAKLPCLRIFSPARVANSPEPPRSPSRTSESVPVRGARAAPVFSLGAASRAMHDRSCGSMTECSRTTLQRRLTVAGSILVRFRPDVSSHSGIVSAHSGTRNHFFEAHSAAKGTVHRPSPNGRALVPS